MKCSLESHWASKLKVPFQNQELEETESQLRVADKTRVLASDRHSFKVKLERKREGGRMGEREEGREGEFSSWGTLGQKLLPGLAGFCTLACGEGSRGTQKCSLSHKMRSSSNLSQLLFLILSFPFPASWSWYSTSTTQQTVSVV